jgi:peptide/nickel transport system substrate-binding protein
VTPGNPRWLNAAIAHPARSLDQARQLLRDAGFKWSGAIGGESALLDGQGKPVEFSIITSASNADRSKMATLIQDDLRQLGMHVNVVPLELRSLIDRVTSIKDYDACVLGAASFDADPNSEISMWLSSGAMHLWNPSQSHPTTPWESEIDQLIQKQLTVMDQRERKKHYDRVQKILAENQPMIFLASPDVLAGAKNTVGNFHPAVLEPYVLWNVEQLYLRITAENVSK